MHKHNTAYHTKWIGCTLQHSIRHNSSLLQVHTVGTLLVVAYSVDVKIYLGVCMRIEYARFSSH